MTLKWYRVLVAALVLVTSVRVKKINEGWPFAEAQSYNGDNPRAVCGEHDQRPDYNDEQAMEPEMRNNLSSKEGFSEEMREGEGLEKVIDKNEVEDLAYDSDIEKINTKTGLDDVDTGKQSRDDNEMAVQHRMSSDFRRTQHWDDKPKCFIVRRGRRRGTFIQKDLPRDTRELVTPEPSIYYDMKRAKRRMLSFPRHGSEDRSTWGAKIIETLETALNTAAKKKNNMDSRQSKEPERNTVPNSSLRHKSAKQHEDIIRTTLLTDHRIPTGTNNQHERSNSSTSDRIRSEKLRAAFSAHQRRHTLPYYDLSTPMVNVNQIQDVDPHKREKLFISWSRYSDSDDSSDEDEARADVMPYIEEGSKYVMLPQSRNGQSSSFEQDYEHQAYVPKKQTTLAVLLQRTTTLALKHKSDDESSVEKISNVMKQQSVENPKRRVENFYPFKQNHQYRFDSRSNEHEKLSQESSKENPINEKSPISKLESSQKFSLKESKSQESIRSYPNDLEITKLEKLAKSSKSELEFSQKLPSHLHHEPYRTSTSALALINTEISRKSNNEKFSSKVGQGVNQIHPDGHGRMLEPEWPVPEVISGLDELFELPEASSPMRKHWATFYKSVSRGDAMTLKPLLMLWLQYLLFVI